VPSSSSHPGFQGCQHALGPNTTVCPVLHGRRLSGRCSRKRYRVRHCGPLIFLVLVHATSTFLRPFAPPALPGFHATMDALTPARLALRTRVTARGGFTAHEHLSTQSVQVSLLNVAEPSDRSVSNHPLSPSEPGLLLVRGLPRNRTPQDTAPPLQWDGSSLGLRHSLAGSPRRPAESSSLALRTDRSPPVALHPASRRRSYLRLRSARALRQGLSPCCFDAITGALAYVWGGQTARAT
jgi:hypothetical protein